jgi:TetR/AcrR family transcriptional regulator, regulator of cefoperazone and chloramphenicol sensitivity
VPGRTTKRSQAAAESTSEAAAEATRAKLIEAAAEIFAQVGYHRATIREICARAGVNGALINYHFGDKLELYNQVLQRLVNAARIDAVRAALNQQAPPEKILREVIKARLRGVSAGDQSGRLFRILAHEMAHPTPTMTRIVNGISRPVYNQLCEIVGALAGLPAADEKTRLCAHSIMGQVILYVLAGPVLGRLWPELKTTPEQLDRIADHITDFSLAYLRQAHGREQQTASVEGRTG